MASEAQRDEVAAYVEAAARKSDLERTELSRSKTGVFTGAMAVNPATEEEIPIWVADYVLGSYGSGAIMAVPGHDDRDYEFAMAFGLPVRQVVEPEGGGEVELPFTQPGKAVASSGEGINIDGMATDEAKRTTTEWLEKSG